MCYRLMSVRVARLQKSCADLQDASASHPSLLISTTTSHSPKSLCRRTTSFNPTGTPGLRTNTTFNGSVMVQILSCHISDPTCLSLSPRIAGLPSTPVGYCISVQAPPRLRNEFASFIATYMEMQQTSRQ